MVRIAIPESEARAFGAYMATDEYLREERLHKEAVHAVISRFLSAECLDRPDFPELVAEVFGENDPDTRKLGLTQEEHEVVSAKVADSGIGSFKDAIASLSGGGVGGYVQLTWIPRAVRYGLGKQLREAFRLLVDGSVPLAERVDRYRDVTYEIQGRLRDLGGFDEKWRQFRASLGFVGTLLGGYDPSRYVFYAMGPVRRAFEDFGAPWPSSDTAGERYEAICGFMAAVADELRRLGIPVKDLIDVQSFIWVRPYRWAGPGPSGAPGPAVEGPVTPDLATVAKDLADAARWPLPRAERLVRMATTWGQLLFQGPPGTGKTYVAEVLARLLSGDVEERVELVQFHPSYAYEDLVEGIRPRLTEDETTLRYELRRGIFLDLVERAKGDPGGRYFLVIDEINRANLPRVLGELLYALEYRGPQHTFRLPYSGRESYVPENLTIIGTMNTADRSIAFVDAAIRRRFRHVHFAPDLDVLRAWLAANGLSSEAERAVGRLQALNAKLLELLDADRLIGHTYLMRPDLADVGLGTVWEEDIEPVLREHLYNRPEEIEALRRVFLEA